MIAFKATKLWKFLKPVKTCVTSDPETALSSNMSRYRFFQSYDSILDLRLQTTASIMMECENLSRTSVVVCFRREISLCL